MGRKLKLGVLVAFFVLMLSACTYAGTYRLTVNKGTNCVTVYEKQGNNYVPIKAMICSVGANILPYPDFRSATHSKDIPPFPFGKTVFRQLSPICQQVSPGFQHGCPQLIHTNLVWT